MSTLKVDKIKGRTGTTVTIPDSQNLAVTGNLTVTGNQSFAAGAQLNLQGENINTGTRGQVLYYDSTGQISKLDVGSAGAVLKSDGTDVSWGAIGGAPSIYYVAPNGQDAAGRGGSVDTAFKTVKYACGAIGAPTATTPAIIFVKGGVYEEVSLPIVVPPYTTISGDSLRTTIIKPGAGLDSGGSVLNTRSTLFRLSNGTIIQDLVLDGMGGYAAGTPAHAPENATIGGIYFQLNAASPILEKSPYIYNVTTFGSGSTGALIDGALHGSGYKTMLFHTYTHIADDGLAIYARDNGAAEVINCFSYFCQVGYASTGGAQIRSLNSSNSYGEYGIYSAGYDATETSNNGSVKGTMLTYTGALPTLFTVGEQITGGTSSATAYVAAVLAEPKVIYIVGKSGTFQAGEVVTGGSSSVSATLDAGGSFESNQSGRLLVTTFTTSPSNGDSVQFASVDGNAYQIQTISAITVNSVDYKVLKLATSRATPVPDNTTVNCRKRFSTVRLTGHDFLKIGTGDKATTNWPGEPTQPPSQADQIITNTTDPGRVYYVATDELGNFYVGDYFGVDQATGKVTLDSSAFDLKGLESLQLGSVGGLIGAQINEFSTDATLSQNSNDKVPTQAAVKGYVDALNSVGGNFDVGGNLTVTGNMTVSGTTTSVNTTNTTITDKLLELANGTTGSASGDAGIIIERGSESNIFIGWDESSNKIGFKKTAATGSSTGDLTFTDDAALSLGRVDISGGLVANEIIEKAHLRAAQIAGAPTLELADYGVFYYTTATSGAYAPAIVGDGSTSLNAYMADGEAMTFTIVVNNSNANHIVNGFTIDGTNVFSNIKWVGGAPSAGDGGTGIDTYTFSIIKTGSATFTVIGNLTKYE